MHTFFALCAFAALLLLPCIAAARTTAEAT